MASFFKKPKRNFRRHANASDSENEKDIGSEVMDVDDTSHDSNVTELISDSNKMQPKEKKKKSSSSSSTTTKEKEKDRVGETKSVLSFCHEDEEDTEVFRVKKSSHSKRIAKQLKKEKKEKEKDDKSTKERDRTEKHRSDERDKKSEHKSDSEDEELRELNLKKLREELRTLNGDEAEALESSEDESGSIAFRSRLARGEIPDAKTIHFIRKQRQMARNTEDFIVIDNNDSNEKASSTSRLVRDDDHDKSDDDDEEERVDFSVNNAARERQKIRDDFMAAEHGSDSDDKEEEKWEEEQIKKAVKQMPDIILQQGMTGPKFPGAVSGPPDLSRYGPNLALPAPPMPMPAMSRSADSSQITIESVRKRLQERLDSLDTVYRGHKMALDTAQRDMDEAKANVAACKQNSGGLEERYRFFQEMRGYVRDLVECLNEKVPSINELEMRMHNLLRARATRLLQRRQQDVRDQCQDYMTNKTAGQVVMETEEEQAKQRRAAEREARRSRRRRTREARLITSHHEGLSSDDEESQADKTKLKLEQENIGSAAKTLFDDALDDFVEMDIVRKKFQNWKEQFGDSYREAYIALCIPKLVNPFVRLQLSDWNPLEEDCKDFEEMNWYRCLIFFGGSASEIDPEDSDIKILPTVIEKILLPKLTYLVENIWDPLSTTQTARLVNLSHKLFRDYPTVVSKSKPTQLYLQAVLGRIKKCLDDDVFMPLYPMSVLDNRSSGPAIFFHRQSWTCIKLLGNILSWHGLLGVKLLRRVALDGLLNRYIVLGLANSHVDRHAMEKCQAIISTLPKVWFQELEGDKTLPQLENLCRFLIKAAELVHKTTCKKGDIERQEGRLLLKQMSKQLVTIHAMDHALTLSNQYSFKLS